MMKKRKSPNDDGESGSEMDVDEEKVDVMDDDDEEEDEGVQSGEESDAAERREDNSFMDNFYGLSSSDPSERAQAANAILHHSLIGPEANINDAAYALRRLLNGLCSGRAASRQGNASALASFLKVALAGDQLKEIQNMDSNEEAKKQESILAYVRHRLLKATDPSGIQGKKKGSEERDYQFGRLFGILSVARSGILLPHGDKSCDNDDILEVSMGFVSDLIDLYSHKKWMREPAAHAVGTILNIFYADKQTQGIAANLVEELVVPKLLSESDITEWKAEQIALALTIQCHKADHKKSLPSPLDAPILSTETMPAITPALIETSSVALPRTHLVWDCMWLYVTEPENGPLQKKAGTRMGMRKLREKPLLGSDSTRDIIEALVRHVIVEGLLKIDSTEGGKKTTHEKRALAMCLVRNIFGATFNSSITGATKIQLEAGDLENILTPLIIRRLFLDVICAGGGTVKKAHTLKPLALQILESMVASLTQDASEGGMEMRLRMAKSFVKCEPNFDVLTKTTTVSDLVGLNGGEGKMSAIQNYFDFLEEQIMSLGGKGGEEEGNMLNYLELLYQSSKRLLRHESGKEKDVSDDFQNFTLKTVERVVGFFMAGAFFDCTSFSPDKSPGSGKKKKKSKAKSAADKNPVTDAAERLNQICKKQKTSDPLPYNSRFVLSERFYSLLAEYVAASIHAHEGVSSKDAIMLDVLCIMCNGWKMIEAGGAKPLFPAIENTDEDGESQSAQSLVFLLQGMANDYTKNSLKNPDDAQLKARKRCVTGSAALASVLFLHLLGCGKPEDIMDDDDVTTEDDDDSADILDAIEGIAELTPLLLGESREDEGNPLAGFAEVCMGVFSNRISSGSPGRGASPRLLRDAVKFAWMGVLSASAASDSIPLDASVLSVLLSGVGADRSDNEGEGQDGEGEEEEEGDESSDEDINDDETSDNELADFSKVRGILEAEDKEGSDDGESDGGDETSPVRQGADDGKEVEINPEKLNSLLEDDSDADIDEGELEHHAGADAALAQLIKLKQDARKASRQARERMEIEKQLRCALLLEILLGKSESWAALLRCDLILGLSIPLLSYRKQIETSLSRGSGKSGAEMSTKQAMLDRLTSILKMKLFKLKYATMPASESVDKVEFCESLATSLMKLAQASVSKDHRACCSAGLVCAVRAMTDSKAVLKVSSVYCSAVDEWATKRTCRLEVSLFDDFINHCPSAAQATLATPVAAAAKSARSPFLRCEAYRLLALLFNPKLNPKASDLDNLGISKASESVPAVAGSIIEGLKDDDMLKAKRVREVLKACERVVEFATACSVALPNADELSTAVAGVSAKMDNKGVKSAVEKVTKYLESLRRDSMDVDNKAEEEDDDDEERDGTTDEGKGKKDKKKKKKKKRGKK